MTCLRSTSASSRSTFQVKKTTGFYPRPSVDANGKSAVGQAGGVLLTSTVRAAGLDVGLSAVLGPWRPVGATHDPAKVLLDLAITLALGGDICSDLAVVRAEPAIFGRVASDPTASRTIARLAADVDKVLPAIDRARAAARSRVWAAARAGPRCRPAAGCRCRRHARDRALGEGECPADVQEGVRVPPVARSSTTAPRGPGSRWRSRCDRATPGRTPPPTTSP